MAGDDNLERRLRDVLHSRHLAIAPDANALARIHERAQRRQRRRTASATIAGVAVIAAVASALVLRPHSGPGVTADNHQVVASASIGWHPLVPTASLGAPDSMRPSAFAKGSPSNAALPSMSASNASDAPTVFNPVSVSAISTDDWWVLGYSMTTYSDGTSGGGAVIVHTTDGGQTFSDAGNPGVMAAQAPMPYPAGTLTVSDIRFGNANDGWAYGQTLFSTTDGGASWSAVDGIPGGVVELVAANGVAWAIVDLSAFVSPTPPPSVAPGERYAIYSTPYGKGAQHWTRVMLPIELGDTQPSIADQDGTVTVLASGPVSAGNHGHALVALPGKEFGDHRGPCSQDLGGNLSNSKAAIWASCPTGHDSALWISTDRGMTWHPTGTSIPDPVRAIGAFEDQNAIVYDADKAGLSQVTGAGSMTEIAGPAGTDIAGANFIGFTNPSSGFAVVQMRNGTSELLRTTDAGQHWPAITLTQ